MEKGKFYQSKEKYEASLWICFNKERINPFYSYFFPILFRYGRKYNDPEQVKDCIQDVFTDLTNKLKVGKLPAKVTSIRAYLCKSLDYAYRNKTRHRKNEYTLSKLEISAQKEFQQYHDEFHSPELSIENRNSILSRAYNSLPFKYKKILLLRSIRGYTYKKVARLLGLSTPVAAQSRFRRAMKQLKANVLRIKGQGDH